MDCEFCGASLAAGSYRGHLETQHNVFWSFVLSRDIVIDCRAVVYPAFELPSEDKYYCPVSNCAGETSTRWDLRWHFLDCHPQDLVVLPSKGSIPFPKCERCGMQTEIGALYGVHRHTRLCREGWTKKKQHEAAEAARVALRRSFTAYGEDLERVEVFKYLGGVVGI